MGPRRPATERKRPQGLEAGFDCLLEHFEVGRRLAAFGPIHEDREHVGIAWRAGTDVVDARRGIERRVNLDDQSSGR
jgi:hypothetical protein